jgi:RNA polymerase sigma-70 factor (ECF subfamily)
MTAIFPLTGTEMGQALMRPVSPDAPTDEQLAAACLAGEDAAWQTLYERHFPAVERVVHAVGVRDDDADDLCQEIFMLVHKDLRGWKGQARLSTWLYRVATREAIRFARRRRRRRLLLDLFARERRAAPPPDWSESEGGRRQYLRQLLDRLPPERRLVLVLFEIEGIPAPEIARITQCAEKTVWTRLHRARTALEQIAREGNA